MTQPTNRTPATAPARVEPNHLGLGELVERLRREDPAKRVHLGFRYPHSYRGDYFDLAFELAENITVGDMLTAAESAFGTTYQGWKGGDYTMGEWTSTWLVTEEGDCGESLGAVLLEYMLADVVDSPGADR